MREKLIELLQSAPADIMGNHGVGALADHLIANGVTFATDNNVGDKWIPVTERLPDEFEQSLCVVLRPINGGKYVREFRVLWCDYDHLWNCEGLIVTHWMPMPDIPKGE